MNTFTKADLKDGMVVTYRSGKTRILFSGKLYSNDYDGLELYKKSDMEKYNRSLLYCSSSEERRLDIMKVEYMGELIWQREPEPEQSSKEKQLEELYRQIDALKQQADELKGE